MLTKPGGWRLLLRRLHNSGLVGQRHFGLMTYCNPLLLNELGQGSLPPRRGSHKIAQGRA